MKIKDGYILRNIADEWIIVPVGAKVYDLNGLMTVNETGAVLWKRLMDGSSREDLLQCIMNEFEIDDIAIVKAEIDEFIDSLIAGDVLEIE